MGICVCLLTTWLTVHPCCAHSLQKFEAENFLRMTVVVPLNRAKAQPS